MAILFQRLSNDRSAAFRSAALSLAKSVVVKFHFNSLKDFLVGASARFPLLRSVGCETLNRTVEIRLNAKEK
jgi:hypothetical protein